jgi:hypothetical protein
VAPYQGGWVVAARTMNRRNGLVWQRLDDPFAEPPPAWLEEYSIDRHAPFTLYLCPDGKLRVFTNDLTVSPYRLYRCPLYCWEIEPEQGFRAVNRQTVYDGLADGQPFRHATYPSFDFGLLNPHAGGREQVVFHRGLNMAHDVPTNTTALLVTPEEKEASGMYYARLVYDRDYPGVWSFG